MLDFHADWFLVLLGLFIFLYITLDRILFAPLLRIFKEREQAIDGALEAADEMGVQKEDKLSGLKKELTESSKLAKGKFDELRAEGLKQQKELMDAAAKEALGIIEKAREELRAESDKARATLRVEAEKFSDEIVSKLLKV